MRLSFLRAQQARQKLVARNSINIGIMTEENGNSLARPPHRRRPLRENKNNVSALRQWLNIIFMVGAVIGVILYFALADQTVGIIIILISMVFKSSLYLLMHKALIEFQEMAHLRLMVFKVTEILEYQIPYRANTKKYHVA